MSQDDCSVNISALAKNFGQIQVLHDISLNVESGEFIVFLGESGCGKSTLLRIIAGLEPASSGEISIGDRQVHELAPGQRDVSMVFQSYALYPHMSVRDNLTFGLVNLGLPRNDIERRINEAVRILEIPHLLNRKPSELSGGQRQRVAIARAIVREPKVFLFDEPLSNLDAGLRVRTRVELAKLHARLSATMLFVTHDQIEAMTLASRIVILHNKGIEQVGSPIEIYTRPRTLYVGKFLGAPGMNFLPIASLAEADGSAVANLPDGSSVRTALHPGDLNGDAMTLGIRPEHLVVTSERGHISGTVETVEKLGDRSLLHTRLNDGSIVIGTEPGITGMGIGAKVNFLVDGTKVTIFDRQGTGYHPRQ